MTARMDVERAAPDRSRQLAAHEDHIGADVDHAPCELAQVRAQGFLDEVHDAAAANFDEREPTDGAGVFGMVDRWNRLAITFRTTSAIAVRQHDHS